MSDTRTGWLDAGAGVAGDMLLGALLDAGADLAAVRRAVAAVHPDLDIELSRTQRHQIQAARAVVVDRRTGRAADAPSDHDHHHDEPPQHQHDHEHQDHRHDHPRHGHHPTEHGPAPRPEGHADGPPGETSTTHGHDHHHRGWREVRALLQGAGLDPRVRDRAIAVFSRLARAEGSVHGVDPEDVHFHEVGALDAIGDVVGCVAALTDLGLDTLVSSPLTVGHGEQVLGEHGRIPIPGPAVLHLVREAGVPVVGGPVAMEMTTPTGAALVAELAGSFGPAPAMVVTDVGVGAGSRDPDRLANVCRVVLGEVTAVPPSPDQQTEQGSSNRTEQGSRLLQTTVDDLDPRIWPTVITALLAAGADDAWLSPVLMKKGRPAQELSVLCDADRVESLVALLAAQTSSIGFRELVVQRKHVIERDLTDVDCLGVRVAVKVARHRGRVVNVQPEFRDVEAAAARLDLPVKQVLAAAVTAAAGLWGATGQQPRES